MNYSLSTNIDRRRQTASVCSLTGTETAVGLRLPTTLIGKAAGKRDRRGRDGSKIPPTRRAGTFRRTVRLLCGRCSGFWLVRPGHTGGREFTAAIDLPVQADRLSG
jgi:hypothetical protein